MPKQEPGTLDTIFNSSLTWPQQLLWRAFRIAKEEGVDIFSRKGFMDPALLPILGWFADHKEDVMPDYMAKKFTSETLGIGEGKGFVPEIATAVLTDPLFFLTGPLTGSARAARGVKGAGQAMGPTALAKMAAEGLTPQQFADQLTVGKYRSLLDEGEKVLLGTAGETSRAHMKAINKARKGIDALPEDQLGQSLKSLLQQQSDRRLGIGIPGLAGLGAQVDVPLSHKNWWQAFTAGTQNLNKVTHSFGLAFATKHIAALPWVDKAIAPWGRGLREIPRQLRGGLAIGGEAKSVTKQAAHVPTDAEMANLQYWAGTTDNTVGDIMPQLAAFGKEETMNLFMKNILAGEKGEEGFKYTTAEALQRTMRSVSGGKNKQDMQTLWGHLAPVDGAPSSGIAISDDPGEAAYQMERLLDNAFAEHGKAVAYRSNPENQMGFKFTEEGEKFKDLLHARKEGKFSEEFYETFFNAGAHVKKMYNRAFVSGADSALDAEAIFDFQSALSRNEEAVTALGRHFYESLDQAAKGQKAFSTEELNRSLGLMLQISEGPGELAASMRLAEMNPSNALKIATSQDNYAKRFHSVLNSLGHQLMNAGLDTPARKALLDDFRSNILGHMPVVDERALALRYEDIIRTTKEYKPLYTEAEKTLMQRPGNSYSLWGTSHKARQIGRMSDDEITESLDEIRAYEPNQSYYTVDEIDEFLSENDAFTGFASEHGLDFAQTAELLGRRQRGGAILENVIKNVTREVPVPLWPASRQPKGTPYFSTNLGSRAQFNSRAGVYKPRPLSKGQEVVWMDVDELLTMAQAQQKKSAIIGGRRTERLNPKKLAELRASLIDGGEALREPLELQLNAHRVQRIAHPQGPSYGNTTEISVADYGSLRRPEQHHTSYTSQVASNMLEAGYFDGYHRAIVLKEMGISRVPVRLKTNVERASRRSPIEGGTNYGTLTATSPSSAVGGAHWPTHLWVGSGPEQLAVSRAVKEDLGYRPGYSKYRSKDVQEATDFFAEKGDVVPFPRVFTNADEVFETTHRGSWTVPEAEAALAAQGFRLEPDLVGGYRTTPTNIKERGRGITWKNWGWTEGHSGSLDEVMEYTDDWIATAERKGLKKPQYWREVHSPQVTQTANVRVPVSEVADLKAAMSPEQLLAAKGYKNQAKGRKVFREHRLKGQGDRLSTKDSSALDYSRLLRVQGARELSKGRKLKEGDRLYEGHVNPKLSDEVTVSPARPTDPDQIKLVKFYKDLFGTTRELTDVELPKVIRDWAEGSLALDEFQRILRINIKKKGIEGADVPYEILQRAAKANMQASRSVVDQVLKHLPEDVRKVYEEMMKVNADIFTHAHRSGVWIPGSPVGYLGHFFNTASRVKLNTLLDNMDAAEMSVMTRLGQKTPDRFRRHSDTMSMDQLDELHRALRQDTLRTHGWVDPAGKKLEGAKFGTSAQAKQWADELEDLMKANGMKYRTFKPGKSMAWTDERLNRDPIMAMLMRLSHAGQSNTFEDFFGRFLTSTGKAPGESLAVGGKIIDVLSDAGDSMAIYTPQLRTIERKLKGGPITIGLDKMNRAALLEEAKVLGIAEDAVKSRVVDLRKQLKAARKKAPPKKIPTVKTIEEYMMKTEFIPEHIVLETDEGVRHLIHSKMSEETGFGWLDLGNVAEEAQKGYTPTVAKSFVSASLRSDLHNRFALGALGHEAAAKLVGHNVVFGSHANVAGAIKTAGKSMEIAPAWVRSFDNINFFIKQFQTVFRVPFHVGNISSGVFQAHMAGVGPRNLVAGYGDAMRMLHGPTDNAIKSLDVMQDALDVPGFSSKTSTFLPRHHVVNTAKRQGLRLDDVPSEEVRALGLNRSDDITMHLGDRDILMADIMEVAGAQHLFTTFASSLTRGTRTTPEQLLRLKFSILDPEQVGNLGHKKLAGRLKEWKREKGFHPGELREHSEVVNRLATVCGLIREGHTIERAVQITKQAHVPYERLTSLERNGIKRLSVFYTFPRHYIPWAWTKFIENPSKLAGINNLVRDQKLFTADEGTVALKLGDYRLNAGRMNANLEAALFVGAFADNFAIPLGKGVAGQGPEGHYPYDPNVLTKQMSTMGLTSIGGAAGMFLGTDRLGPQGTRSGGRSAHSWEEAMGIIWPIKLATSLVGKALGGDVRHPMKEEMSPYVDYTPMESFISNSNWGMGVRKVRPQHEFRYAYYQYKQHLQKLRMRIAATEDTQSRQRLIDNARVLAQSLQGMAASAFDQRID